MKIALLSMFRNSTGYIDIYIKQVESLTNILYNQGDSLLLILGFGDSSDDTGRVLEDRLIGRFPYKIIDVSHGGEEYGSTVHEERFKNLAFAANKLWQAIPSDADYVIWLESDLIVSGETLASLLNNVEGLRRLRSDTLAPTLLAPMIYTPDGRFYDTWAFVAEGIPFELNAPYHWVLADKGRYVEVDSVGSAFVMNGELARQLTWPCQDVVRGLCKRATEHGARIFVDKYLKVVHP